MGAGFLQNWNLDSWKIAPDRYYMLLLYGPNTFFRILGSQ